MADVAESASGICLKHSKSEAAGGGSGEEDWIPELGLRDRASTKHADQQYRAWVYCTSIDFEIALPLIQAYTHLKSLQVPACTTSGNCTQIASPTCFFVFFIEIHFSNSRGCTREGRINNISQCDIIRHRETGRSLVEGTLQCGACIVLWLVKYQNAKKSKLM